jgi:mono/diheme cytochrome c family protein
MKQLMIVMGCMVSIVLMSQSTPSSKASAMRGKKIYTTYCLACHQADGGGVPRMNPPLIKTEYVNGDKVRLIKIILKGLNDPIEINGDEYSNPMASHAFLNDQQVADVLSFVRSNFGNKSGPITPAEVKAVRAKK